MSLSAEDISYTWSFRGGESTAIRSFSGQFAAGVPHLICGPSGSGKSTLGYLLSGLLSTESGRVTFNGEEATHQREEIALVFQFPEDIFFEDTLEEELKQLSSPQRTLDMSCFDALGIPFETIAQRHPFHLSAGYGRLVATAMQLARNPRLLILDEPTIGLDWIFQRRMLDVLRNWITPQRTLVIITHDLDVLRELDGEAWVLNQGMLAWNGATSDLLASRELLEAYALAV